MFLQRVVNEQAICGIARDVAEEGRALQIVHVRIGVPLVEQEAQALAEIVRSEVRQAGALTRNLQHGRLV